MRQEIERRLGLKGYNIYGLSEIMGPCVSYECEEQDGSHICEDHFFPEVVDPETLEPLPYGQPGELVFTTLTKEGMPLLRYRTRDLCALYNDPCPCGRTAVRMGRILGRSDDMLIIRGINVFPSQVESVILSMPECAPHFLLVVDRVDNLDTLTVQVEVRQDYFAQGFDTFEPIFKLERELAAKLRSVLSINAKVQVKSPGTLARSEGKSKFVIDNRVLK
jgi:phenylacetate-CoA ligase